MEVQQNTLTPVGPRNTAPYYLEVVLYISHYTVVCMRPRTGYAIKGNMDGV